jgi:pimeloyl-ACP methyl ester carboxylesterase
MPETFVLIPGAWHGGWAWRPVAQRLRASGHRAISLTMPGLTDGDDPRDLRLSDAVDYLVAEIRRRDLRNITLVGHSWAGYPITGAAHQLPDRVRRLIYWNAFVPADGRPLLEEIPPEHAEMFEQLAEASCVNGVTLPFEAWQSTFIQDAKEPVQRLVHSLLVPQPLGYFTDGLDVPPVSSLGVPASYVYSTEDIALPPGELGWAPRFPDRLGVSALEVPGSHESCFTRPNELADALLKA